jgi:hypothetical protein
MKFEGKPERKSGIEKYWHAAQNQIANELAENPKNSGVPWPTISAEAQDLLTKCVDAARAHVDGIVSYDEKERADHERGQREEITTQAELAKALHEAYGELAGQLGMIGVQEETAAGVVQSLRAERTRLISDQEISGTKKPATGRGL